MWNAGHRKVGETETKIGRMEDNRLVKNAKMNNPVGKRVQGRPPKRWRECWTSYFGEDMLAIKRQQHTDMVIHVRDKTKKKKNVFPSIKLMGSRVNKKRNKWHLLRLKDHSDSDTKLNFEQGQVK